MSDVVAHAVQELDELESLGSADAIANRLRRMAYRGAVMDSERCPLSVYLRNEIVPDGIDVTDRDVHIRDGDEWHLVQLGPHCAEWIRRFDEGEWLDLVEDESDLQMLVDLAAWKADL